MSLLTSAPTMMKIKTKIRSQSLLTSAPTSGASSPMVPCVNRPECAALLDVSLRTLDRMIADREIPFHHVRGKLVRFKVSDVEAYLALQMTNAPELRS